MYKYFWIFIILNTISCKEKNVETSSCFKKDIIIKDTIFNNSNILTSIYFEPENCKIKKVDLLVKLDERSGDYLEINDVVCKLGIYKDTLINLFINSKDIKIKNDIISFEKKFQMPFLDSINFIDLKTIGLVNDEENKKILKSESYFYNNSTSQIGIKNSYLDYNAFKDKNLVYKTIGRTSKNIDSLEITAKILNQNIDDIVDYEILINNKLTFKLRHSIKASFTNYKSIDNGVKIYDVRKMTKNFIKFKLDISRLKIKQLDAFKLLLNNEKIQ